MWTQSTQNKNATIILSQHLKLNHPTATSFCRPLPEDFPQIKTSSAGKKKKRKGDDKKAENRPSFAGGLLSTLVNVYICRGRLLSVSRGAVLILLLEVLRSRDRRGDSIKPLCWEHSTNLLTDASLITRIREHAHTQKNRLLNQKLSHTHKYTHSNA